MSDVDTSAEAVERLAAELCARWDDVWDFLVCREKAAATLRALLAERDNVVDERDELWNRVQRIQEYLGLPEDCTAQRIIDAISERVSDAQEMCASVQVKVTVPDGAEEWSPLEAWEEGINCATIEFRETIRNLTMPGEK